MLNFSLINILLSNSPIHNYCTKVETKVEERVSTTTVSATYTNTDDCMVVDKFEMQVLKASQATCQLL